MSDFIIRALGGVPRDSYHDAVVGRQAVIDRLRKDITILDKRIDILSELPKHRERT
jgi:hypothetical protein